MYTVIGVYGIDNARYAVAVEAADEGEAEERASVQCLEANGDNLIVAAVIEGNVKIVG
jgi:hypothetical protein